MSYQADSRFMDRAIEIALASEQEGNLPIGAVIALQGEIIGEGHSAVLEPEYNPGRHAEIMAIRDVDPQLWPRARQMTCYTTLEPCVMCAGTLLLHGVGRVVFGAHDTLGGAGCTLDHLPPYYDEGGVYEWIGPTRPEVCDALYERADAAFESLPVGRSQWTESQSGPKSVEELRAKLDEWCTYGGDTSGVKSARQWVEELANRLDDEHRSEVIPYARAVFEQSGYLKDYRALKKFARRADHGDVFEEVEATVRQKLPDVWIRHAIEHGDRQAAIDCWFEYEEHHRARLCAEALVEACDTDQVDVIISCRMSVVNYLIGRRARRHYRRACAVLRKLRDELMVAGEADYWEIVIDDIQTRYDSRPALLDELARAGFRDA